MGQTTEHDRAASRDRMLTHARRILPVLLGLGLFAAGIFALYRILAPVDMQDVFAQVRAIPVTLLIAALAATATGYGALIGYDWSALRYLHKKVPFQAVIVGGFLGYSFGNTIGVGAVSGGAVRYRIYSAYGLNAFEVAAVSTFVSLAFGLGITIIGLFALMMHPQALAGLVSWTPSSIQFVSGLTLAAIVALVSYLSITGKTLRVRKFEIPFPRPGLLGAQLLFSLVDTCMAALTLYILLPAGAPGFATFLAVFVVAVLAGVASHVPGGVGVFESIIVAAMPTAAPLDQVAAALLLYRLIYYLVPFALAMVFVAVNEARIASGPIARLFGAIPDQMQPVSRAISSIAPSVTGTAAFGLGVYLILMSLMPSVRPHGVDSDSYLMAVLLESGAMLSAALGVALILLAQGLMRRISAAFWLMQVTLLGGVVASMLNGFDVESALILGIAAMVMWPIRREFFRSARLTQNLLSPGWFVIVAGLVIGAMGFLFLMHAATPYSADVWFRFASGENMPRAMRAGLVAAALLTFVMIYLALQPARARRVAADAAALAKAAEIVRQQDDPEANLALTGDKSFFFSENEDAFIMFAVQGKSWVAYDDPVGAARAVRDLAWAFYDAAYHANARPVFYEVSDRYLSLWIEMGLTLHKLGEEAVVELPEFSLAGRKFKKMRAAHNQAQRNGLEFEMLAPPHDDALIKALRQVSDAWLATRGSREKGFSVGKFDPAYLQRFPIGVARKAGQIVAFANVLTAQGNQRLSVDLMRYVPEVGNGMMEYLFIELLQDYRDAGAQEFSLGMAPLAGLEARHGSRLWTRFGAILFRHGGTFYNFEGLRAFKQKFGPRWRPRFLAVPGALPPFPALKDVTLLISGGAKGLIGKNGPAGPPQRER